MGGTRFAEQAPGADIRTVCGRQSLAGQDSDEHRLD